MRSASLATALVLFSTTAFSIAAWQRLPVVEKVPVNLATKAIPGTHLVSSEGVNGASALLSGGNSETASLMAGRDEAVIELVGQHSVNEVDFTNDSAEGKAFIATSLDGKKWQTVGQHSFTAADRLVEIRFALSATRYVKATFDISKSGGIRGFGVFGATSDQDYKLTPSDSSPSVNLAGGVGGSRAIYAWPQPVFNNESEIKKNIFRFPKSKERYRIIVYDLGTQRQLKEFATSYSERPTRVEVFTFVQLPETPDWKGHPTLDPTLFDRTQPVGRGEDPNGAGHIKIKLDKTVTAQYVALRFEPNYTRHARAGVEEESWTTGLAMVLTRSSALVNGLEWLARANGPQLTAENNDGGGDEYEFTVNGVEVGAVSNGGGSWTFEPLFNTGSGPTPGGNANGDDGNSNNGRTFNTDLPPDLSNVINNLLSNHSAAGAGSTNPFTAGFTPFTVQPFKPPHFPPLNQNNNNQGQNNNNQGSPVGPTSP